jgi:hypothetical protein
MVGMNAQTTSKLIDIDTGILLLDVVAAATELADKCCWAKGFDAAANPYPKYYRFNSRAGCSPEAGRLRKAIMAVYYAGSMKGFDVADRTLAARGVSREAYKGY